MARRRVLTLLYTSIAPIPFATMTNKEWGNIGNNYLKGLFALAFQGFFMMVCVGIYAVLVNAMTISSDLHEIATFKNGKYDTAIKYYLVETKTLDGYTLDQTKHEVTFAYADDSTPVVEVTFNLTNEKPEVLETPNTPDTPQSHEETKVSNAPKTGDSTNIWLPILLLVISTGGMAGLYIIRKRKSK